MKYLILFCLLMVSGLVPLAGSEAANANASDHAITAYNTYAYQSTNGDGETAWVAPMRLYVSERRPIVERLVTITTRVSLMLSAEEARIFRSRIRDIVADSESGYRPGIRFDQDPENHVYPVEDLAANGAQRTDLNGIVEGQLTLSASQAETLLQAQDSEDGWLSFTASAGRHHGRGWLQLIEPEGLSVISDIDDTVKVTEMPAGRRTVVSNTFLKEYEAAPGMAELYREWDEAAFHYVSGSPWQLYNALTNFLFADDVGYPRGSLHMKNVRKNLISLSTWRDLSELAANENVTFDQKRGQIEQIIRHFPHRQFILVGDSGERDPEIYASIRAMFPDQIAAVYIRDVVNDRNLNPERLEGMRIIPAPTVLHRSLQPD